MSLENPTQYDLPMAAFRFPFLVPEPARLSERVDALRALEASHQLSNFGPLNTQLERRLLAEVFGGEGSLTTVANATLGLILSIRAVVDRAFGPVDRSRRRYAVMPSFTFAAVPQAALWCNLTPLFCDIDERTWTLDRLSMERVMEQHAGEIAIVVACSTFGCPIDLDDYEQWTRRTGIPYIVDSAGGLGTETMPGHQFGQGSQAPVIFSLHATKPFAMGEGGIVYSADASLVESIRRMSNFGFDSTRTSASIGLNAKISEHSALLGITKLDSFQAIIDHRQTLHDAYRELTSDRLIFQESGGSRQAHAFCAARPRGITSAQERDDFVRRLAGLGIEARTYFSPALHEQPFFRDQSLAMNLETTERIGHSIVSLPLYDSMTVENVREIAAALAD